MHSLPHRETDSGLVARTQAGHTEALRLLLGRYESAALARIRRRLAPALARKIDPEDVLQEAYLVAAAQLDAFEPQGENAFGRWFARIVELKVREAVRRHTNVAARDVRRELTRGARPDTHAIHDAGPTPSRAAGSREEQERVRAALSSLDDKHREILELVRFHGYSLAQAADQLQCSSDAAKKRFARALMALGAEIKRRSGDGA